MPRFQNIRTFLLPLLAVVILAGGAIAFRPGYSAAASSMPLAGYAWSQYLGWIDFSGTAADGSTYGVLEDLTGLLSGYAWSSNIGWITFNQTDLSGCPSGTCTAQVNLANGAITGWARACSAFANKNACSGTLDPDTNGWDGWIALSGTATDGSTYGVTQTSSCEWQGYAWGSDAIGAISMSGTATDGSTYGVSGNNPAFCSQPPTAACTGSPTPAYINQSVTWSATASGGSGSYTYSWTGTDGLSGTSSSVSKAYTTSGLKYATTTVTDTVSGLSTSVSCTNDVTVNACTATLTATPSTVNVGNSTTLDWSTTSACATSCTFADTGSTSYPITGSRTVTPPQPTSGNTVDYSITCSGGPYGPTQPQNIAVTVLVPSATISASPQRVRARDFTTITWGSVNVNSCTVSGPDLSLTSTSGSQVVSISSQSTYTISCTTNSSSISSVSASTTVNTVPSYQGF
ncbi:MAG TPA: hypothetical protein VNF51_02730 [Candidatus Paceibacterota bacterium]|nr:hypothetical protein [Candidatus Paceibacterota bacterium]